MAEHSEDYYEVLGLQRGCGEGEIKRAYKKLALKWHPDKNPDNRDAAEAVFKRVSEAYDILSDQKKRQQYDMYGKAVFSGGGQDNGYAGQAFYSNDFAGGANNQGYRFRSAQDIFSEFFGGRDPFAMFGDPFMDVHEQGDSYGHTDGDMYRGNQNSNGNGYNNGGGRSRSGGGNMSMKMNGGMGMNMGMGGGMGNMGMGGGFFGGGFGGSPFDDPFFQTSGGGGGGFSSFSSSSVSSRGGGGVSKSVKTSTSIINGQRVTKTTTTTRDANGNVQTHTDERIDGQIQGGGDQSFNMRLQF